MEKLLPKGCYVILHIGLGPSRFVANDSPPLVVTESGPRFLLSDAIWIERLDQTLASNIQKACEPPNFNIGNTAYDRHLYAFVRQVPDVEKSNHEGIEDLFGAIALSRLIHPTSIGDRYCAKVFHFGLQESAIQSVQYRGMSPDVFLSAGHRDWLSVAEAEQLRSLMPWLSRDKRMHHRVHRAYWSHEYAMRSYYLDMRWILVVSGLEALISVGEKDLARQFRDRVGQLAAEFQIDLQDDDLRSAYKLRSKLVHAESFLHGLDAVLPQSEHGALYGTLESVLRNTLRRCLLEETFGDFFSDDAAIGKRWPLS
jgi:hypothetical protein